MRKVLAGSMRLECMVVSDMLRGHLSCRITPERVSSVTNILCEHLAMNVKHSRVFRSLYYFY